ncbi:hypothetical protein B0H66DRAFT_366299 [Apodospora peruviana]|uniref:Uncharacterized protein n=1 Tax=Apodospora peruviana TaxID=516989 RepID=A0AAE0HW00_9PEZI|nr:hypothetical protein B0H66DRAFT_366299 [Apodospora peruviana]
MKSSAIRPTRGRPNKVTKPAAAGRGTPGRLARHPQALHDALAAEHDLKQDQSQDPASVFEDTRMGAEDYAAAAAAAVAMETGLAGDGPGEAEADADMEDDDPAASTSGLGPHVDLTTAANILANGGAGPTGGNPQLNPQDQHQAEMQQALAQAQAQQHQQPQAQMGNPQQMQAHQPMDPSLVRTTEDLAHESGYTGLNVESALAKRLAREPGHRHAQQRRPEQQLNLGRRSNVEALFAHIAGEPARVPCKNCHKGHGPWTSCIVVDGQMCGSCANCWFNASGARCSFHETRNPQAVPQHASIMPAAANTGIPTDAGYRNFATPHGLLPNPPMPNLAHAGLLTGIPVLHNVVNKAITEVRQADKVTRQLMLIEATAKQLALQIAEYEEMTQQQDPSGGPGPGQQVMGDDGGA